MHTYKEGEVLIFKSSMSDSIVKLKIVGVKKFWSALSEAEARPNIHAEISYTRENDNFEWSLLNIYKVGNATDILITFENSYFEIGKDLNDKHKISQITIGSKKVDNVYVYNVDSNLTNVWNDEDLIRIYWQKNLGIIKYDLYGGDSYIRINL